MMTDILGRPRFDPNVTLQDIAKAIAFFQGVINVDLPVDIIVDECSLSERGTGVQVFIEDDIITIGRMVVYPGCHTMSNGDPGYPDTCDFEEVESFTLDLKNDAIDRIIGMIAVEIFKQAGESESMDAYAEELNAEQVYDDLDLIGSTPVPGSAMNHLRREKT